MYVMAYYEYATSRLSESVPKAILYNFLKPLGDLRDKILESCNPKNNEALLDEGPGIREERESLNAAKERLVRAQDRLRAFHTGSSRIATSGRHVVGM